MRFHLLFLLVLPLGLFGCGSEGTSTGAVCGDATQDPGEECDDGNTTPGDGCDATCNLESTCGDDVVEGLEDCDDGGSASCNAPDEANPCQFKTRAFKLTGFECPDPAPSAVGGLAGICPLASGAFFTDGSNRSNPPEPADGSLDLNFLILMEPLDQAIPGDQAIRFVSGDCAYDGEPENFTSCSILEDSTILDGLTAVNKDSGDCLVKNEYYDSPNELDPVSAGDHGCFSTPPGDFTLAISTLVLSLKEAELAFEYDGTPATGIKGGVLRGFITAEDANTSIIPILGIPFSTAGAQDPSCAINEIPVDDRMDGCDMGPDGEGGTTLGWWVHIALEAEEVIWNGGPKCGNGVVDSGEACDPQIPSGEEGACPVMSPADCAAAEEPVDECTDSRLINGDKCNPSCAHVTWTDLNLPPAPLTLEECLGG